MTKGLGNTLRNCAGTELSSRVDEVKYDGPGSDLDEHRDIGNRFSASNPRQALRLSLRQGRYLESPIERPIAPRRNMGMEVQADQAKHVGRFGKPALGIGNRFRACDRKCGDPSKNPP
jgi:hypothetical protein